MFDTIAAYYTDLLESKSDPRVADLFLMKTPSNVFGFCSMYILLIVFLGPKVMEDRKSFKLKKIIATYNVMQVFISGYIFYECLGVGWMSKYGIFKCHSINDSDNSNSYREMRITYIYFLSKFTEFFDTIFFVLRKKSSQVTFLHVYHHVSMPLYTWMVTKFYPGGSMTIVAFLNSFIHIVMYSYYLLAGLGQQMQKYLWWKKYLTVMQLIQFAVGTTHFVVILFSGPECNISKQFILFYIGLGVFFYLLFYSFYSKNYENSNVKGQMKVMASEEKNGVKNEFLLLNSINNNDKIKCP